MSTKHIGTRIRLLVSDLDTGPQGGKRHIPKGRAGTVQDYDHGLFDVVFDQGGWLRLTHAELHQDTDEGTS